MTVNDRDRQVLQFEVKQPATGPVKNDAIRAELGLSPARYYQILDRLTLSTEALELEPALVRRLQRHRERVLS